MKTPVQKLLWREKNLHKQVLKYITIPSYKIKSWSIPIANKTSYDDVWISNHVLKQIIDGIVHLAYVINMWFSEGIFPILWKTIILVSV